MPIALIVVASVEPYALVAVGIGTLMLGFYLGVWVASRWYRPADGPRRGRYPATATSTAGIGATSRTDAGAGADTDLAPLPLPPHDLDEEDAYLEVWERLLEICYQDWRVQAVAGYDRGFFATLHEPLFSHEENDDSPLLPGEIAFGELHDPHHLREYWQRRRHLYFQATNAMPVEERLLYRRCLDDAVAELARVEEHDRLYRLLVRTPGRQHVVLLPATLRDVLGVVPGPPGFDDPYF